MDQNKRRAEDAERPAVPLDWSDAPVGEFEGYAGDDLVPLVKWYGAPPAVGAKLYLAPQASELASTSVPRVGGIDEPKTSGVAQPVAQGAASDNPMLSQFTCEAKTNTAYGIASTLYFTRMGAHGVHQLYRNEAEALYNNIGMALAGAVQSAVKPAEGQ